MDQYLGNGILYELDPSRDPIRRPTHHLWTVLKDLYAPGIVKGLRGTVGHYEFSRAIGPLRCVL